MEKLTYPLVCYQLSETACLGILVGTTHQVVEKDIKAVKKSLAEHLQKQYKKYDDYPYTTIPEARMKTLEVRIRPTHRDDSGQYPYPNTIKVPLTAVFGFSEDDYYECYFPLLGRSFYYYDPKQFRPLANHFAKSVLDSKTPEEINKLFLYPEPVLEEIYLKVNHDRDFHWGDNGFQRQYTHLSRFAERYPYSKSERRRKRIFPEAAWELEDMVNDVADKISRERVNVLIVGEGGTGKSAVLKQAFKKLTTRLKKMGVERSFWRIMPQRITASSKYLGEWQEKCDNLVQELQHAQGTLWVEDIAQLILMGGQGPEDSVAAFLSSYLRDGQMQMVGEVSPAQLESMRRMLPGFVEHFQIISLKELPEASIFGILDKFSEYSHKNLKIRMEQSAVELAYRLLLRYYPYEKFPGKAVRFLGRAIQEARASESADISAKDVISQFSKETGLPELFLRDDLKLDQTELREWFTSRVIGQPDAADRLGEVVKIYKAGLNNPHKPISTLLFTGPTGVGKTASAKALADYFFGKGQKKSPLIRIDMSEFRYPGQIRQLIGEGREVGKLVKEVRERPFAVLLLDEVEKAHPAIFDALLTVLDEGRLVDAYGRVTNFRNVIIIMTSNLGASNQTRIGYNDLEDSSAKYMSAISQYFRPEFVNRIDGVVMFNALRPKDINLITRKELADLAKREGVEKNGIRLTFTEALLEHIRQVGFDERYGARPLQRAIEDRITAPLARWLMEHGEVAKGKDVALDYRDGVVVIGGDTFRQSHS